MGVKSWNTLGMLRSWKRDSVHDSALWWDSALFFLPTTSYPSYPRQLCALTQTKLYSLSLKDLLSLFWEKMKDACPTLAKSRKNLIVPVSFLCIIFFLLIIIIGFKLSSKILENTNSNLRSKPPGEVAFLTSVCYFSTSSQNHY